MTSAKSSKPNESAAAPTSAPAARAIDRPLVWGFTVALGLVLAAGLVLALFSLSGLVFSIFMAAFITVGLDPLEQLLGIFL